MEQTKYALVILWKRAGIQSEVMHMILDFFSNRHEFFSSEL